MRGPSIKRSRQAALAAQLLVWSGARGQGGSERGLCLRPGCDASHDEIGLLQGLRRKKEHAELSHCFIQECGCPPFDNGERWCTVGHPDHNYPKWHSCGSGEKACSKCNGIWCPDGAEEYSPSPPPPPSTPKPNMCPELNMSHGILCISLSDVTGPQDALLLPYNAETMVQDINNAAFTFYKKRDLVTAPEDLEVSKRVNGMEVLDKDLMKVIRVVALEPGGVSLGSFATIKAERGKDPELVQFNRDLGVPATAYAALNENEKKAGITVASQFGSANENQLTEGLPEGLQLAIRSSITRGAAPTPPTAAPAPAPLPYASWAAGSLKGALDAWTAGANSFTGAGAKDFGKGLATGLQGGLQSWQNTVKTGLIKDMLAQQEALTDKNLQEAQARLQDIMADTEMKVEERKAEAQKVLSSLRLEQKDLNQLMQSRQTGIAALEGLWDGAADSLTGVALPVDLLLAQLGVFRGIVISPNRAEERLMEQVVALADDYQTNGAEKYRHEILTKSDQQDQEWTVSFESASQASMIKSVFSSMGSSSAMTFSSSLSAGGFFGGGLGGANAKSTSSVSENEQASNNQQNSYSSEVSHMYKLHYLISPAFSLHLDRQFLKPSEAFSTAADELMSTCGNASAVLQCKRKVVALFGRFGTHVCPVMTVGGYFEMQATVHAQSSKKAAEMENIATWAMTAATESGMSTGFASPVLVAGGSATAAGETKKESTFAAKTASMTESSEVTSQVSFESKGGQAGLSPDQWRKSLKANSNWAVIDRSLDQCLPLWALLPQVAASSEPGASNDPDALERKAFPGRQALYDEYLSYYLPEARVYAPKDVRDFGPIEHYIKSLSSGAGCTMENSTSGLARGQVEESRSSCSYGDACLKRGAEVQWAGSTFHASLGCLDFPCCTAVQGAIGFRQKGCKALAGIMEQQERLDSKDGHALCRTGVCCSAGQCNLEKEKQEPAPPEGMCACPENTSWETATSACVGANSPSPPVPPASADPPTVSPNTTAPSADTVCDNTGGGTKYDCSWTAEYNCPGQPASATTEGEATPRGSDDTDFECCCNQHKWEVQP